MLAATLAHAGSDGRKGTAGATELLLPVGPRGTALGGAVASDVTGIESMFWNPAGLGGLTGTEAMFTHQRHFADNTLNFAGVATNAGRLGTIGLSAKVLSIGDVIVTTESAPDGTGEILSPTFAVLGLGWGKAFTDRVNFGLLLNYVHEDVANNTANGLAMDFGVQFGTGWHGFRFGMTVRNIGKSMEFSGPGFDTQIQDPSHDPNSGTRTLDYSSAAFELPSYLHLAASGLLMSTPTSKVTALGAFQSNSFSGDQLRGGLEWGYKDLFMLRGSYFGTFNGTIDSASGEESFAFDSGDDIYEGFAMGAGVGTRFGESGRLGVDFSWRPTKTVFEDVLEFGLRVNF
jgi:hypothetical protein